MKNALKYLLYGIAWGWGWFVIICIIADLTQFGAMREGIFNNFTQNALASAAVGIACGSSAIVYTIRRLRRWQQSLIHFCTGIGVYLPVAFSMRWLPAESAAQVILGIIIAALLFMAVWCAFYLYHSMETKQINARLKLREAAREENEESEGTE